MIAGLCFFVFRLAASNLPLTLQGLAFFRQGYVATQKVRHRAEERVSQIRSSMARLREEFRTAEDSAEEGKRQALADKDAVITQISRSLMERGSDLIKVERERDLAKAERDRAQAELEKLRVELDELRASSRSHTESLGALESERGQLKDRLREEQEKNEELRRDIGAWKRREANLPFAVVAKYVETSEFKDFVERLTVGAFQMGALEYRNAILVDNPVSLVESADQAVPALLAEPELSGAPPPPQFSLSQEDYDREVKEGTFEDLPESKTESEKGEVNEGVPAGEPSILAALADDPVDPPEG